MIIYIHGPDAFRSREKLRELVAEFKKKRDPQGYNITRLQGQDLMFDRFRHEALSSGFLSPRRLVVVEEVIGKGGQDITEKIVEFLKSELRLSGPDANVLVFWEADGLSGVQKEKPLKKKQKVGKRKRELSQGLEEYLNTQRYTFHFPLLAAGEVQKWIIERVRNMGGTIERTAVDALATIVGSDLWRAANEVEKLIAWRLTDTVRLRDITALVESLDLSPSGFEFLDAVGGRATPAALTRLYELIHAGNDAVAIHALLTRLFRTICLVKSYLEDASVKSKSQASEDLGLHPYVVKKTVTVTQRFSWGELSIMGQKLLQLDSDIKGGSDDPVLALEMFVIEVCK